MEMSIKKCDKIEDLLGANSSILEAEESEETKEVFDIIMKVKENGRFNEGRDFVKLCEWKSPRGRQQYKRNYVRDDMERINDKFERIFNIKTDEKDDAKDKMGLLSEDEDPKTRLYGVGKGVASAILMFLNPDKYGVLDYHVWDLLTLDWEPLSVMNLPGDLKERRKRERDVDKKKIGSYRYSTDDWWVFIEHLRQWAEQFRTTARRVERCLFIFAKYKEILEEELRCSPKSS